MPFGAPAEYLAFISKNRWKASLNMHQKYLLATDERADDVEQFDRCQWEMLEKV